MAVPVAPLTPSTKVVLAPAATLAIEAPPAVDVADPGEPIGDADMWRAIITGATVGSLGVFLLVFVMCLVAGIGAGSAAGVSLLPAIFGGVYAGGAPTLLTKMVRFENGAHRR